MKKSFLTGIVFLLPLAITIWIIKIILDLLTQPFLGIVQGYLQKMQFPDVKFLLLNSDQLLRYGSKIIILVGIFLVTLGLGVIARWFLFKTLFSLGDKLLHRIPIVNKLYKTVQEVIQTLFAAQNTSFKTVVMVTFPNSSVYSIGLLSNSAPEICLSKTQKDLVSVFVPTTPNPTTGYLVLYPKDTITVLDMTVEEAVKFIVSCGVISTNDIQGAKEHT